MCRRWLPTLLVLGLVIVPAAASSQPPSIAVLSSNATKAVVEALAAGFEKASGARVNFTFANSADTRDRIEKGAAFDVAILSAPTVGELIASSKLSASTRTDIARAGVGVAIKRGAARPDISTPDALKQAIGQARSIAYVGQGATAPILRAIFARFGIADAVNAKTKLVASAAHAVAAGEAELGFTQISEILNVPGAELLGPLPASLQVYTTFQAAVSATSKSADTARAFIAYLTTPAAGAVITEKGMERVTGDRLPPLPPAAMTAAQRQAVADFKSARGADLTGPFHPLLRSPELMTRTRAMGDYLRYKTTLPPRLSEFVILMTSRAWTQQYEWNAHYPIAIKAGLNPQVAVAIAEGRRSDQMSAEEAALFDLCTELHRDQSVSDPTYARAVGIFGEQGVVEAIGISGYYTMLAMVLNTARTPAVDNGSPVLGPLLRRQAP
jgi:ABC-type molybdate transport system substrate-binding protein